MSGCEPELFVTGGGGFSVGKKVEEGWLVGGLVGRGWLKEGFPH